MLGTLDLDDVELRSPDEILASLGPVPSGAGHNDSVGATPIGKRADDAGAAVADQVHSDDILHELEQHHLRTRPTPVGAVPRGSAELERGIRRTAQPSRRRRSRLRRQTQGEPRSRYGALQLAAAALVIVCAVLGSITILGQQGKPETSVRASTLTGPSTGLADSAAKSASAGVKTATSGSRRSQQARRSRKLGAGGRDRQHKARHTATYASTRRSSPAQDTRSDTTSDGGATTSYVSTRGEEPVAEHAASTVEQPPSTASSDSAGSDAAGPSGLGGAVGGNCNPKCS